MRLSNIAKKHRNTRSSPRFLQARPITKDYSNAALSLKKSSLKSPHAKIALVGFAVIGAAFALPSPYSWITFIIGLQLFAPLVGKKLKSNDALSREETIKFLENQLDSLGKDIARAEKFETGLTTHNKRIKYKAYFEMLEKIRNDA